MLLLRRPLPWTLRTPATHRALTTPVPTTSLHTDLVPELPGTVPPHHAYIFLHTAHPPSQYPAKFTTKVHRRLLLNAMRWGGAVNFAWDGQGDSGAGDEAGGEQETYSLTAFSSARGKLEIRNVSLENVDDVARRLEVHTQPQVTSSSSSSSDDIHLYVCTHGARDCRCGETGGAVVRAIRDELRRRKERGAADPSGRVKLAEVAHVGGHKYAANVLVYPHGEWLGEVKPDNVREILDAILGRPTRPMTDAETPICPSHWRGRMGLTKEEQVDLFTRLCS
ncbi:Sucrase/ferredoxin-like-domain-containing protein [Phlebopus sp. FC_14]|nr:Sucrase/ferredoxin-like-domain-containing protein [Phlebopus sp. FC_14]